MSQYKFSSNLENHKKIFQILFLLLAFIVQQLSFADEKPKDSKVSFKTTHLKHIQRFVDLPGGRYTVGYGYDYFAERIIPLAIYDKTFPEVFSHKKGLELILSSIGVGDLHFQKLREKIEKKKSKHKIKKLEPKTIQKILLDSYGSDRNIYFDKNWWKDPNIKWKKDQKPDIKGGAPEWIALSALDFSSYLKKKKKSNGQMLESFLLLEAEDYNDLKSIRKSELNTNPEETFFVRQRNGSYLLKVKENQAVAPVKIIDLQGYNTSYKKAFSWVIRANLVKVLISISQIPITFIPQALSAVSEKFLNYIEVLYLVRHQEALSLIVEAKLGRKTSPFFALLNDQELDHSIQYLRRSFTFFSSVIKNTFVKKENVANKYLEKIKEKHEKNIVQLKARGYKVIPFENSNFALGIQRNESGKINKLEAFSLIKRKTFSTHPHPVVDFLDPLQEYYERNVLDALLVASAFGYDGGFLMSLLFFAVKMSYKEIVIREIQRYQMQEGAFLGFLDYNREEFKKALLDEGIEEKQADNYIKQAYKIVKKRSINPLFLTRKEAARRRNKSELWLMTRDPSYKPFGIISQPPTSQILLPAA